MKKSNDVTTRERQKRSGNVLVRIIACILILGAGVAGFRVLKNMKKPPVEVEKKEHQLKVVAVQVQRENIPVAIQGYGEISSQAQVALSAEIAGKVIEVHPRLEAGEIIAAGELLFRLDDRDITTELQTSRTRLATLKRDHELATKEFKRAGKLYKKNKVGSLSKVEQLERAVNSVQAQMEQVEKALLLAEIRLSRSVVRAPFTCRIKKVDIEKDQYLTPGKQVLVIVDDRQLEIQVPLDSRDASRWLRLSDRSKNSSWFGRPEPVECKVQWLENEKVFALGTLERIVDFDSTTRTMRVAVSLTTQSSGRSDFPLTAGMFCKVTIPGRTMVDVFALPRWAVSFENTVYTAVDKRLHTVPVEVARREDKVVYVKKGLQPGDLVLTTRLDNPLENTLLNITLADKVGK